MSEATSGAIDYRDLLKRYMDFVGQQEGITFVSHIRSSNKHNVKFSPEEISELEKIDAEPDL